MEKVIRFQTASLKKMKVNQQVNKAKKTPAPIPDLIPVSALNKSAIASNSKAKKTFPSAVTTEHTTNVKAESKNGIAGEAFNSDLELPGTSSSKFEFSCPSCPFTTSSISYFKRHEAFHKDIPVELECLSCSFMGDNEMQLEKHVMIAHANETSPLCFQCGFLAGDVPSLEAHLIESKHRRTNIPDNLNLREEEETSAEQRTGQNETDEDLPRSARKTRAKLAPSALPYRCKYCNFRGLTENGMNQHWKKLHPNEPLDFDVEPQSAKTDSIKIFYCCSHCGVQGLFEELKKHSKTVHPNLPPKVLRIVGKTQKRKSNSNTQPEVIDLDSPERAPKKLILEAPASKNPMPSASNEGKGKSEVAKVPAARPLARSQQTVFVVAQPQTSKPAITPLDLANEHQITVFVCFACQVEYRSENEVIRHHASDHTNDLALRYVRVEYRKSSDPAETSEEVRRKTFLSTRKSYEISHFNEFFTFRRLLTSGRIRAS